MKFVKKDGCSRGKVIRDAIDLVTKETQNKDPVKKPKEPAQLKITSIDGIPIEKFHSGEYKVEFYDNGIPKKVIKVGIIDQVLSEIFR